MQKTAISPRQAFFLGMPLLIIMGHFFLVPVYLRLAGRDAWLGVICGFACGIVIFIAMGKLQYQLYTRTIIEAMHQWLGPWFGRIMTLPLILYFFTLSVITLYGFSVFISSIFLVEHPQWIITVTFTLVLVYMVHQGIEVIARVSEWILLYNIVSGSLVSLSLHTRKDYSKLLPILENGIGPVIPVIIIILAIFGEMIVMLMLHVRKPESQAGSHVKLYLILFMACIFIFPSTAAGPVAIFGVEQAQMQTFPVESMVRLISVGFIERFDIYGLTIMTVSALLRLCLLHYATSLAVSQWLSIKDYRWVNVVMAVVLVAASLTVFDNYMELLDFFKHYYPYGIGASGLILVLWIVAGMVRTFQKRKGAEKKPSS
ncbi:MAG: spore germination protein [Paenibacillaceae bacterium]|nr:spore germination protein [Paenibacillaceae bacterium]